MAARSPVRLALIGRSEELGWCAPGAGPSLRPEWIEPDALPRAIEADVVVCLQPGAVDPEAIAAAPAPRVAWLGLDGPPPADLGAYDRVVVTGPVPAGVTPWRSQPPPVADALFAAVAVPAGPPAVVVPGSATPYRDLVTARLAESFELDRGGLPLPPAAAVVVCVLASESERAFPAWIPAALATGALVVSEPLEPLYGLEPGIDFLQGASAAELQALIALGRERPDSVLPVRRRGQAKVEVLRASRAWPALVADLARDLAAFG